MNLVQDPWLPFLLKDGTHKTLPISAIVDEDVVDFALPRADFHGAAYQFSIGLLQTVFAPKDRYQWLEYYENPPETEILQKAFDTAAHAFNAVGDGPLFMQDFNELEDSKPSSISGLLIEAPGGNGIKLNTDHFVKRGIGETMSLEMALLALFTLQINAPAGGVGHRVGLRGGGPLSTLVLPQNERSSLWQKIWLNVVNRDFWRYEDPNFQDASVFPWLSTTKTSDKKGSEIYASDVHPLHMYWAMPRRIRLAYSQSEGFCEIAGVPCNQTVSEYRAQNYGGNYSGSWSHPLTPYRWNIKKPDEEHLSIKGQPGGITYKIWDVLTLTDSDSGQQCAIVVRHFYSVCELLEQQQSEVPRLWAFGYDMDNMKARGWYSVSLPIFSLVPEQQEALLAEVKSLQKLATDSLWHCRTQIKTAWFERPGDAKGDFSFIDLAFWQRTEADFFHAVQQLVENAPNDKPTLAPKQASSWLTALRNTVLDLFDELALSELGAERSMTKRIKARQQLTGWLFGGKDIKAFKKENNIDRLEETA
ncbi:type I-E CRISPR-associated protein Cse1/CasA [Teredinibacter haidensis]|uniref:type I-E CRISPR-associated protein Cse1/CasA n=1 Tax=Teredinibacter haidensis TaxID=2731755 RepID=UPI000948C273|nr:type I-E CRISPR-associated protein Cse1/CasA [Teredinibacter haidensis]